MLSDLSYRNGLQKIIPIIPCLGKTKEPAIKWKKYTTKLYTDQIVTDEIHVVICNLHDYKCLDVDPRNHPQGNDFMKMFQNESLNNHSDFWRNCFVEETPGGGLHIFFRFDELCDNCSLAKSGNQVFIDLFAEIHLVKTYPSENYVPISELKLLDLKPINADLVANFINFCSTFDNRSKVSKIVVKDLKQSIVSAELFNNNYMNEANIAYWYNQQKYGLQLLYQNGWKKIHETNETILLTRPRKDSGCSAIYNKNLGVDTFYVFTTSDRIFNSRGYNPHQIHVLLTYGSLSNDNYKKSRRDLLWQYFEKGPKSYSHSGYIKFSIWFWKNYLRSFSLRFIMKTEDVYQLYLNFVMDNNISKKPLSKSKFIKALINQGRDYENALIELKRVGRLQTKFITIILKEWVDNELRTDELLEITESDTLQ